MTTILALGLSVRALTCLERANISTVEQIVEMTEDELLEIRNFGYKSLEETMARICDWNSRRLAVESFTQNLIGLFSPPHYSGARLWASIETNHFCHYVRCFTPMTHVAPHIDDPSL